MRIGLINPNKDIKEPAVHLGLGYIASYALQRYSDLHFELLDTRVATSNEVKKFIDQQFDIIGISATSQTFNEALELTNSIRSNWPKMPIVLGGAHCSTVKGEVLQDFPFDYAVYGEGEITFSDLIGYFKGEKNIAEINGLMYRNEVGEVIVNPARELIKDLDSIPFPMYSLYKMSQYPQHRMITTRGCPHKCVFCNSHSIWTNKWRKRSAENIIAEVEYLFTNYSMKSFSFNDDSFNIDLGRVEKFCDYLIEKKTGIIWSTSVRVDRINDIVAKKMKLAGCYNVCIGIESANNEVLKLMSKSNTREKIYEGIQIFRQAGIDVMGQFMIGNPGDTLDTIKESIEYAKTSNLNGVEFYTALPYKDTYLWEYATTHGKMLTDKPVWEYHTINPRIVFETPEFPLEDRLKAIELVTQSGFYHALSSDKKDILLDIGKHTAKIVQQIFKGKFGNQFYLFLRSAYRRFFRSGTKG
jgi:anaerobic magnesium-protoporphyrin IX monomethyl ester cyclase